MLGSREFNFEKGEVLLVNKPYGWTSFDVVAKIRHALKPLKIKVGHAGTLDPLATGLLIVCTGKLTKKIQEFQQQIKEYRGTLFLGATRPSYDMETEINATFSLDGMNEEAIQKQCLSFLGEINQSPPVFSAVKIQGERLYAKARRGEAIPVLPSRKVKIIEFEITSFELPELSFRVVCGKGTYIRSLVHDYGKSLQAGAYLSSLERIRNGGFSIEQAYEISELIQHILYLKEGKALA